MPPAALSIHAGRKAAQVPSEAVSHVGGCLQVLTVALETAVLIMVFLEEDDDDGGFSLELFCPTPSTSD